MNRIEKTFRLLKKNKQKAFIAFITAGYPDLSTTEALIRSFAKSGVDIIELGVPFSDPMADGPVIQEASSVALGNGVNLIAIFKLVKKVRKDIQVPIALMTYYNPVFCFNEEKFIKEAAKSGVDGVIIPDLPPEEGTLLRKVANRFEVATVFFISPTSTHERIKRIAQASRGFIYYVSLAGVTGMRNKLPLDVIRHIKAIKACTDKPVCVGFGVSTPLQVRTINKAADGVIVGSAIVKKIKEYTGSKDLVSKVTDFVMQMKGVG